MSRVLRQTQHIIRHFEDASFQAIDCTGKGKGNSILNTSIEAVSSQAMLVIIQVVGRHYFPHARCYLPATHHRPSIKGTCTRSTCSDLLIAH